MLLAVCGSVHSGGRIAGLAVPQTKHIPMQLAHIAERVDLEYNYTVRRAQKPRIIGLIRRMQRGFCTLVLYIIALLALLVAGECGILP